MTEAGQIITGQRFITGEIPSQVEVNEFLAAGGFEDVRKSCWLWKRRYNEMSVWLGDARADNFVKTDRGIVPIDIRLWIVETE